MMPNIHIDPTLSVYALVQRTLQQRAFINHRRTMLVISHEIENAVLLDKTRPRLFSGFQFMSRFIGQADRYARIAQKAESVYVFGVMDAQPPAIPNITYVPLQPSDQLAKEWFIVADAPDYFTTLATEELTEFGIADEYRQFQGVWSFDEDMVTILQEWLSNLVDARPLDLSGKRNYHQQVKIMSAAMGRLTARLTNAIDKPNAQATRTTQEIQVVVSEQVAPSVETATQKL